MLLFPGHLLRLQGGDQGQDAGGAEQVLAPGALCLQGVQEAHHREQVSREQRPAGVLQVLRLQGAGHLRLLPEDDHRGGFNLKCILSYCHRQAELNLI